MVTLKKVIYTINSLTKGDTGKYVTLREICLKMEGEDCKYSTLFNRVRSQVNNNVQFFSVKRENGAFSCKLNLNGIKFLETFKDVFDPVTDTMLTDPIKVEVIR